MINIPADLIQAIDIIESRPHAYAYSEQRLTQMTTRAELLELNHAINIEALQSSSFTSSTSSLLPPLPSSNTQQQGYLNDALMPSMNELYPLFRQQRGIQYRAGDEAASSSKQTTRRIMSKKLNLYSKHLPQALSSPAIMKYDKYQHEIIAHYGTRSPLTSSSSRPASTSTTIGKNEDDKDESEQTQLQSSGGSWLWTDLLINNYTTNQADSSHQLQSTSISRHNDHRGHHKLSRKLGQNNDNHQHRHSHHSRPHSRQAANEVTAGNDEQADHQAVGSHSELDSGGNINSSSGVVMYWGHDLLQANQQSLQPQQSSPGTGSSSKQHDQHAHDEDGVDVNEFYHDMIVHHLTEEDDDQAAEDGSKLAERRQAGSRPSRRRLVDLLHSDDHYYPLPTSKQEERRRPDDDVATVMDELDDSDKADKERQQPSYQGYLDAWQQQKAASSLITSPGKSHGTKEHAEQLSSSRSSSQHSKQRRGDIEQQQQFDLQQQQEMKATNADLDEQLLGKLYTDLEKVIQRQQSKRQQRRQQQAATFAEEADSSMPASARTVNAETDDNLLPDEFASTKVNQHPYQVKADTVHAHIQYILDLLHHTPQEQAAYEEATAAADDDDDDDADEGSRSKLRHHYHYLDDAYHGQHDLQAIFQSFKSEEEHYDYYQLQAIQEKLQAYPVAKDTATGKSYSPLATPLATNRSDIDGQDQRIKPVAYAAAAAKKQPIKQPSLYQTTVNIEESTAVPDELAATCTELELIEQEQLESSLTDQVEDLAVQYASVEDRSDASSRHRQRQLLQEEEEEEELLDAVEGEAADRSSVFNKSTTNLNYQPRMPRPLQPIMDGRDERNGDDKEGQDDDVQVATPAANANNMKMVLAELQRKVDQLNLGQEQLQEPELQEQSEAAQKKVKVMIEPAAQALPTPRPLSIQSLAVADDTAYQETEEDPDDEADSSLQLLDHVLQVQDQLVYYRKQAMEYAYRVENQPDPEPDLEPEPELTAEQLAEQEEADKEDDDQLQQQSRSYSGRIAGVYMHSVQALKKLLPILEKVDYYQASHHAYKKSHADDGNTQQLMLKNLSVTVSQMQAAIKEANEVPNRIKQLVQAFHQYARQQRVSYGCQVSEALKQAGQLAATLAADEEGGENDKDDEEAEQRLVQLQGQMITQLQMQEAQLLESLRQEEIVVDQEIVHWRKQHSQYLNQATLALLRAQAYLTDSLYHL